jgi:hypothetical protein
MTRQAIPGTPTTPTDLMAILAAMQDQIDDLTAVVEAHQRRLDELAAGQPPAGPRR